jgi:hypothetical protein
MDENAYCEGLVGQRLERLEKRDFTWFFGFSDQSQIATEAEWRLVGPERIIVGSDDHGHPFGLPAPVDAAEKVLLHLGGQLVKGASITSNTGDLSVEFDGNHRLQFLQLSCGYESWRFNIRGVSLYCIGGGQIA